MVVKSEKQIEAAIDSAAEDTQNLSGMSYQDGVKDALEWVLGQLGDEDFEFGKHPVR